MSVRVIALWGESRAPEPVRRLVSGGRVSSGLDNQTREARCQYDCGITARVRRYLARDLLLSASASRLESLLVKSSKWEW